MQLKIVCDLVVADRRYRAGEVIDVPAEVAADLLTYKLATIHRQRPGLAVRPPPENTMIQLKKRPG